MRSVTSILPIPCPEPPHCGRGAGRIAVAGLLILAGAAMAADDSGLPDGAELARWMRQAAQTALASQAGAGTPDTGTAAAQPAAAQPDGLPRVEVSVGRLDPRLQLAPCQTVVPYLPPGSRALGQTRIGLRCTQGRKLWNVYLPVTVKVYARALVATTALPAGAVLQRQHLAEAEVDVAASSDPALTLPTMAVGRTLARNLAPGDALRQADLKPKLWFAAGDTVRVVAVGAGFQIAADAQALGPGIDGQNVRARIEGGRIVSGLATGDRRIEVPM